jgi:hypothetical protein
MLLSLALGVAAASVPPSVIEISKAPFVSITNANYASWTIDSSYNRGFVHNDFTNANLLAGARSLAPSTVRFGGGGNDCLHYEPFAPCGDSSTDNDTNVCLNTSHWDSLHKLASHSGSDFIFGLSYDRIEACTEKGNYTWKVEPAIAMIKYIQSQNQSVWGFELGNEINNHRISCDLQPAKQAAAFVLLKNALQELYPDQVTRPKLLGPDIGYLDPELYLGQFLGNFSDLYAVTYHVYSKLERQNYDKPALIDHALHGEGWYPSMVRQLAPGAEIWAGEDGPHSGGEDGTCGAKFANGSSTNTSVCGTFATAPWYANDLGLRAVLGFKQYMRQDLIGGRYGLLGIPHDGEALRKDDPLSITADYWVHFLWKRVMGKAVLNATAVVRVNGTAVVRALDPALRVYAHCGRVSSVHGASSDENPLGITMINIDSTDAKTVVLASGIGSVYTYWTLSAGTNPKHTAAPMAGSTRSKQKLPHDVFSQTSVLNGHQLPHSFSKGKAIGLIPVAGKTSDDGNFVLPPFSVTFAVSSKCPASPAELSHHHDLPALP